MSTRYHTSPPPFRPVELPEPEETPLWRKTLRFEDAPDILTPEEAAVLARLGTTAAPIYDILKEQETQRERAVVVANPLRVIRRGERKILVPKDALREWLMGESAPSPAPAHDERLRP